jgi:hypothetical protein
MAPPVHRSATPVSSPVSSQALLWRTTPNVQAVSPTNQRRTSTNQSRTIDHEQMQTAQVDFDSASSTSTGVARADYTSSPASDPYGRTLDSGTGYPVVAQFEIPPRNAQPYSTLPSSPAKQQTLKGEKFFESMFGDETGSTTKASPQSGKAARPSNQTIPSPAREAFQLPDSEPVNPFREKSAAEPQQPSERVIDKTLDQPPTDDELFKSIDDDDAKSLGDLLEQKKPSSPSDRKIDKEKKTDEETDLPKPKDRDSLLDDPFGDEDDESVKDKLDRDRLNQPKSNKKDEDDEQAVEDEEEKMDKKPSGVSCADFREQILRQTIDQVSLDISPPFRPDEISLAKYEKLKDKFDTEQKSRQWRTIDGAPLAEGALRELAYEKVVLQSSDGTNEIPIERLSEADLAYIAEVWGLPTECLLPQEPVLPRSWSPLTMTWKASNQCHTPLYFEDVNLERYGHTHGPLLEPIVQSAHFFGGVLVLPYKMGVHKPNECIYSLGYYRPGNCAPWIVPPVPISLQGAINQTAVLVGGAWLIP